ncbi:MAG: GTPase HflX [Alphaproteobacteria bacterium]
MHNENKDISNANTLIIHPILKKDFNLDIDYKLEEAKGLAGAIDLPVIQANILTLNKIIPGTYIGTGKIEEYKDIISENEIGLVIIDTQISPIQQRNLEKAWNCKVIDRTALIIEIFANRARTREGKLQVDLAALEYQKSRLVRSWTHLERQRGGFGFMGGPGEKQIESDRRAIRNQIRKIRDELDSVKKMRKLHRKSREAVPYPIVALVGYTNSGKTTLFNLLASEKQYAEDKLFATLDPTMRQISLPSKKKIIISDTVGFISDLPTELVAAFSATLEEVIEADIILHVMDISHLQTDKQKQDVEKVLSMLGIERDADNIILVKNKIDLLEEKLELNASNHNNIFISAKTGENMNLLLNYIDEFLSKEDLTEIIKINNDNGKLLGWVYDNAQIKDKEEFDDYTLLTIKISEKNKSKLTNILNEYS